jgi:hypothetical protein
MVLSKPEFYRGIQGFQFFIKTDTGPEMQSTKFER